MKSMRPPLAAIFTARKCSLRRLCFYTCLSVHGGGGVVSQHALQQIWGGWYLSMPCRFPGPHPRGGGVEGSGRGGLQAHTQGVCIPDCTEADPPRRLLLQAVRILLECILVYMTYFHRAGRGMAPSAPPGSATDNKLNYVTYYGLASYSKNQM